MTSTGDRSSEPAADAASLPSASSRLHEILSGGEFAPAVLLDYDGTLTPIVSRPEAAWLSGSMRATLERLAAVCPLAILSGRDLEDVRRRVGLAHIWYAGSHGFDIAGPGGQHMEHPEGVRCLPVLDAAQAALQAALGSVTGAQVERKRFAIAVHYRRVARKDVAGVERRVEQVRARHTGLRCARGKKVLELQPDVEWHKGKALRWLMDTLNRESQRLRAIYIGDDTTDEDAFAELTDGAGILVSHTPRPTRARYRLADPAAVEEFLNSLADALQQRPLQPSRNGHCRAS